MTCSFRTCTREPEPGRKRCAEHLAAAVAATLRYRAKNLRLGRCRACPCPQAPGSQMCRAHRRAHNERIAAYRKNRRAARAAEREAAR